MSPSLRHACIQLPFTADVCCACTSINSNPPQNALGIHRIVEAVSDLFDSQLLIGL